MRSVLEQSCVVWNSSITQKNEHDIERVQRIAFRLIYGTWHSYENILKKYNLQTLKERRDNLMTNFAKKCTKNKKTKGMFIENKTKHNMKLRNTKKYNETKAMTKRLKQSSIPAMERILNEQYKQKLNTF